MSLESLVECWQAIREFCDCELKRTPYTPICESAGAISKEQTVMLAELFGDEWIVPDEDWIVPDKDDEPTAVHTCLEKMSSGAVCDCVMRTMRQCGIPYGTFEVKVTLEQGQMRMLLSHGRMCLDLQYDSCCKARSFLLYMTRTVAGDRIRRIAELASK